MSNLRNYRIAAGYPYQWTLAEKCHVSQGAISAFEAGVKKPTRLTARAIADVLRVEPDVLFPDGYAERPKHYKTRKDDGVVMVAYDTPEPSPAIAYPREFRVRCWRCGAWISLEVGSERPLMHDELACLSCARPFDIAIQHGMSGKSLHTRQKSEGARA